MGVGKLRSTAYLVLWGTYDGDRRRWAVDVDGDSLLVKRANLFAGSSSLKFALQDVAVSVSHQMWLLSCGCGCKCNHVSTRRVDLQDLELHQRQPRFATARRTRLGLKPLDASRPCNIALHQLPLHC